jgi:hypothetical protein
MPLSRKHLQTADTLADTLKDKKMTKQKRNLTPAENALLHQTAVRTLVPCIKN